MTTKFCFVISPIGERTSPTRRRSNGVLDEIIRPALEPRGYRVERADHDKAPGIVTEALISKILDADLVVADLTDLNPNVMYELAVRHASGRPVIQLLQQGFELPFDISSQNTLYVTFDLAGRADAIASIEAAEEAVRQTPNLGNPVKRTVEFRGLIANSNEQDIFVAKAIVDIQTELLQVRTILQALETGRTERARGLNHDESIDDRIQAAIQSLTIPPYNPTTMVLHYLAGRKRGVAEADVVEELVRSGDPVYADRNRDDIRDAIQLLSVNRVINRTQSGFLTLHPQLAEQPYIPRKDPYRASDAS